MSITKDTSSVELIARSNIALAQMNAVIQTLACPGITELEKQANLDLFNEHRTLFFTAWEYRTSKLSERRMLQVLYGEEIENTKIRVNGMRHCIQAEFERLQQGEENKLLKIMELMIEALRKASKWLSNVMEN
jgi:hypothetical protein